jgi:sugar lactone lactonase YvrE
MRISPAELLLDAQAALGEGPAWDSALQQLYWVDILARALHVYHPGSGLDERFALEGRPGCVAPALDGSLVLGMEDGFARLRLPATQVSWLSRPESHLPQNRFNDGKCGPDGRFLAGTMDTTEKEACGALYSLGPDGSLKTLRGGVRISNGLAWSPDYKTLYYIDTPTRQVMAYDYDLAAGNIANPRAAVSVPEALGWPDGMTSDTQGRLWIALWGGAAVTVWDAGTGQLLEKIPVAAKNVTACVFGGRNMDQLYVTSARSGLEPVDLTAHPASGGLFRAQTNVTGLPTFRFGENLAAGAA